LKTTFSEDIGSISASNLSKACQKLSAGGVVGKLVMNEFN